MGEGLEGRDEGEVDKLNRTKSEITNATKKTICIYFYIDMYVKSKSM